MDYDKMSIQELRDAKEKKDLILDLNRGVEIIELDKKPALPEETPQEKERRIATEIVKKRMAEEKRIAEEKKKLELSRTPASESEESRLLKALVKEFQEGNYRGPVLKEIDRRSLDPEFKQRFIKLRKSLYPSGVPGI